MSTYGGLPMSGGTASLGETLWGFSLLLVLAALRFKQKHQNATRSPVMQSQSGAPDASEN